MTRTEIEAAKAERERYAELAREARMRHEKFLASGEQGNEAQTPAVSIKPSTVTVEVGGTELEVEVYDAEFNGEAQRFAGPQARIEAIRWAAALREAWTVENLGDSRRRYMRSRVKAEFQRVVDLCEFEAFIEEEHVGILADAVNALAKLLLAVGSDGKLVDIPAPGDEPYAVQAQAVIEGDAAAMKIAARDKARAKRKAKHEARRQVGGRGSK